nr:38K [Calliteara abietis nucleopolyhedrovirus]
MQAAAAAATAADSVFANGFGVVDAAVGGNAVFVDTTAGNGVNTAGGSNRNNIPVAAATAAAFASFNNAAAADADAVVLVNRSGSEPRKSVGGIKTTRVGNGLAFAVGNIDRRRRNKRGKTYCSLSVPWTVIRLKRPFARHHLLVVDRIEHLRNLMFGHLDMFEYVIFSFDNDRKKINSHVVDFENYTMRVFKCPDEMPHIRHNIKSVFKTSVLGHVYVLNEHLPLYAFLTEWYVQSYLEMLQLQLDTFTWEVPHVLVFDLDSTLITDEMDVRVRDVDVYGSLMEFKQSGCVLVLWSYGNESHVVHSLKRTKLTDFFNVIICEGHKVGEARRGVVVDAKRDVVLVKKSFYLDINDSDEDDANGGDDDRFHSLPKSPRIVLFYLRKLGVNYIKSLTLIDDLKTNNYAYDYFVNVRKCSEPRSDWMQYHAQILNNFDCYNNSYEQ